MDSRLHGNGGKIVRCVIKIRVGEATTSPRWHAIHQFIERELEVAAAHVMAGSEQPKTKELDNFLFETILKNEHD
jgi:hypothetical protein